MTPKWLKIFNMFMMFKGVMNSFIKDRELS